MSTSRELNPQLFGTKSTVEKIGQPVDPSQPAAGIMGGRPASVETSARQVPYPPIDVKALEHQIGTMKVALLQIDKRTEALTSKVDELARTTHARLERFGQTLARFEEQQGRITHESGMKLAQVVAKVNEQKLTDQKVQELVDRHNHIIRNFENRLLSLQRLVSEQEMALHNAQTNLEEARNEIMRLKRL